MTKYTEQELDSLREEYSDGDLDELSENLGRSKNAIQMKASRLGLSRDKKMTNKSMSIEYNDYKAHILNCFRDIDLSLCLFISGLFTAEGTFYRTGTRYVAEIGMAERDSGALEKIQDTFQEGNLYIRTGQKEHYQDMHRLRITSNRAIVDTIIPFFELYPVRGKKYEQYKKWCQDILDEYNIEYEVGSVREEHQF